LVESLIIIDSSGLCLYSAPLAVKAQYDPDLISGFIIAQQKSFKQFFGENTNVLKLQKRQILFQGVDLRDRNLLIAITHEIDNRKEEKIARTILEGIVATLKTRKDRILGEPASVVTDKIQNELEKIVEKTLKGIRCPFFLQGFLAVKNHCQKTNSATDDRPCDFNYAVKKCERYNLKEE